MKTVPLTLLICTTLFVGAIILDNNRGRLFRVSDNTEYKFISRELPTASVDSTEVR